MLKKCPYKPIIHDYPRLYEVFDNLFLPKAKTSFGQNSLLILSAAAVFVLFTAATGTGVVSAGGLINLDWARCLMWQVAAG